MAVITISRESGALGTYIGRTLAERLGYFVVDREVIHEVCMDHGVRQDEFEHIYERAPGLLERYDRRNREIVALIIRIIRGLAQRDNTVIISRNGFVALRGFEDVLNIRVVAERSVRVQRLQEEHGLDSKEALAMIDRLDSERSKSVGAYHGLNWADAGLYDLAMSTSKFDAEQAIELALQSLKFLEENLGDSGPFVRDLDVDPILERAINEALSLLEAAAHPVMN
jgi:cytidylate kinase